VDLLYSRPEMNPERLDAILSAAAGLRVLVVGDLMLDVYLSGSVTRISPEAPVPVVQVREERSAVGGAGNVAANLAALGARCTLVGYVGEDGAGLELRQALERAGEGRITASLVSRPDRPTTTKTRVTARHQQIVRFDRENEGDLPEDAEEELVSRVVALTEGVDAVVLEDYNKGVLTPRVIREALAAAVIHGVPTVVDPKFRNFFAFGGATVFKPNALELGAALGRPISPRDDRFLEEARARAECTHLLLTLGEDGMAVRSAGGETLRIPAAAREVYDVSGAGDTVTAWVAAVLASGGSISEAALLANLAAAVEVRKAGVATVTPEEARAMLASWNEVRTPSTQSSGMTE
jgi:rfaE bifunctional protein kinase chain/domain